MHQESWNIFKRRPDNFKITREVYNNAMGEWDVLTSCIGKHIPR